MCGVILLSLLAAADAGVPPLEEAERAYREARYELVLPLVEAALATPGISTPERLRAHAVAALVHSAFDQPAEVVADYERALAVDSTFDPGNAVSPRVFFLFQEARKNHAERQAKLAKPAPAPALTVKAPEPAPEPAVSPPGLLQNKWVWIAAGVVAAGATTATVIALQPRMPEGNVPNGQLR